MTAAAIDNASISHGNPGSLMFFKLCTEISSEVEILVTKYIKSGAKAIHLHRTIVLDPELIIRYRKNN